MALFELYAEVTVSAYTAVEADNLEDAIKVGELRDIVLGGPKSGASDSETWVVDDIDGSPCNIVKA